MFIDWFREEGEGAVVGITRGRIRLALACLGSLVLLACGGGGADTGPATLSGRITFDYVPNQAGVLAYAATQARPVRGAPLEVVDSAGTVLARTQTDAQGRYSVQLPAQGSVRLRVKAELQSAGAGTTQVADNTQGGAVYALESQAFAAATATRDLHAPSGWTGASYGQPRSAAPFAILDTLYRSQASLRSVESEAAWPALTVFWSPANKPAAGDVASGAIGNTHFTVRAGSARIYVLGDEDVDTDEYDESVIAHEWGHYYQWAFSRSDSPGGAHAGEPLEMTLAFSEGWGNGWSGLVTGRSDYADSMGPRQGMGWSVPLDRADTPLPGWFDEDSLSTIFWQFGRQRGLAPIHRAMRELVGLPAFASIFSFSHALRRIDPAAADAFDLLLAAQGIVTSRQAGDPFGSHESNHGGLGDLGVDPSLIVLPVYLGLSPDAISLACSANAYGIPNKLGNQRFLRLELPAAGVYRIRVTGLPRLDGSLPVPALSALLGGQVRRFNGSLGALTQDLSLPAGTTALSLADSTVLSGAQGVGCFSIEVAAAP